MNIKHFAVAVASSAGLAAGGPQLALAQETAKHRVLILTDIEADPDDTQSLVRLFLYANAIDIKGLIATTSVHQKTSTHPESIQRLIAAYGQVQPNLNKHEPGYPTAKALARLVSTGRPVYGLAGLGPEQDSPGSEWIIRTLDEPDDRPLWVSVWGGANTLAQALYKLKNTRPEAELNRLLQKLRVYSISDQDDTGPWIRRTFPDVFYVVSPGGYGNATWLGINSFVPGINNETISNAWLATHIQQGHGPLGAQYPDVAYGMEGDTPAWLALIPNGLNAPEHPDWGGWGGRYALYQPRLADLDPKGFTGGVPVPEETRPIWTNTSDAYKPVLPSAFGRSVRADTATFRGNRVTLWRWRDDFQHDFASRIAWTHLPYKQANHPPVPALGHPTALTVKAGAYFLLDATGTTDPDGDNLSYLWTYYPEVGSYRQPLDFGAAQNLYRVQAKAPLVDKPETLHFILRVTDKGTPALSRYKRVIVTVVP